MTWTSISCGEPKSLVEVLVMENLTKDPDNIFFRCVEDSEEAIMITDKQGVLVYVNPAWQKIYGYTWEEAVGRTPTLLKSKYKNPEFYKKMWDNILNPQIGHWKGELVNRSKSGAEIPVLLTITPFKSNGEIRGFMGMAMDIREKRAMEAQILQQDRLASVGLLASGIAHEIGTPLGVVRGRSEFLKMQFKDNDTLTSTLDIIITQIDRVSKLMSNLLNLSRTQQGTAGVAKVKNVCEEAVSLLNQKFRENDVSLVTDISSDEVAKISHNKLEQVVLNLLINSLHAIQSERSSGKKKDHRIEMKLNKHRDFLNLSISDTGCGIDPNNLDDIFKPFFTTKPVGEGTGLGLSICSQLIQESGGNINVESTPGLGTTFFIHLPSVSPSVGA